MLNERGRNIQLLGRQRCFVKIGITGDQGFIGTNLKAALKDTDHIISSLYDYEYMSSFVKENDVIVHLAACNRGGHDEMLRTNVMMTLQLAEFCHQYKKRLISAGSVYDKRDSYALTKDIAMHSIMSYNRNLDTNFVVFTFPKVIGKGCKPFYNSFVTTMAYMQAKGDFSYKDKITNMSEMLPLIWIEDVCLQFKNLIEIPQDDYFLGPLGMGHVNPKNHFVMQMREIVGNLDGTAITPKHGQKFQELVEYYKTYELPKA